MEHLVSDLFSGSESEGPSGSRWADRWQEVNQSHAVHPHLTSSQDVTSHTEATGINLYKDPLTTPSLIRSSFSIHLEVCVDCKARLVVWIPLRAQMLQTKGCGSRSIRFVTKLKLKTGTLKDYEIFWVTGFRKGRVSEKEERAPGVQQNTVNSHRECFCQSGTCTERLPMRHDRGTQWSLSEASSLPSLTELSQLQGRSWRRAGGCLLLQLHTDTHFVNRGTEIVFSDDCVVPFDNISKLFPVSALVLIHQTLNFKHGNYVFSI